MDKHLWIRAYCSTTHGYGQIAVRFARFCLQNGVAIKIQHIGREVSIKEIPEDLRPHLATGENPGRWEVLIAPPDFRLTPGKRTVWFSMWETTRLHEAWIEQFNRCDAVIVPSEFCQIIFDANGVNTHIKVVPLAVDGSVFYPKQTTDNAYTRGFALLGASGRVYRMGGVRKNFAAVVEAFNIAFMDDDNVRLQIKLSPQCDVPELDDDRITVIREEWSEEALADWYNSLDCYVTASRSEAWGLTEHEAMACGTPVVATNYSGRTHFFGPDTGLVVRHSVEPAGGTYDGLGLWAEPDIWSLSETMRLAVSGLPDIRSIADYGSTKARQFRWDDTCGQIMAILHEVGVFSPVKETPVLPSGVSAHENGDPSDDFAIKFGVGRARKRTMPELPKDRGEVANDGVCVFGPGPEGCGVGQFARQVARAIGAPFFAFSAEYRDWPKTVFYHHHRHYWETDSINSQLYELYLMGHDIIVDVHDPGGIEQLPGYVHKVVYHSKSFEGYISHALPDTQAVYVPMMAPDMSDTTGVRAEALPQRPKTRFVVGHAGLWNPHKGVDFLIEAARIWRDRGADIGVLATGAIHTINKDAEHRSRQTLEYAHRMVAMHGLEDRVTLHGEMLSYADLNILLCQCDLFCLPYTTKVPGNTSAGVMCLSFGKPVIVADVPMFADLIGASALAMESLTAECVADTIQHMLIADRDKYGEWCEKAKAGYAIRRPNVVAELYKELV